MTDDGTAAGNTQPLPAAEAGSGAHEGDPATTSAVERPRGARWRGIVAVVLIVVATLLAPVTLAVLWMNHDLLNTDNYVKTVAPLSSNPDVQNAVATDVTDQLWAKVNVQQQLSGVLPSWAQVFSAPLSNQLKTYAYQAIHAVVDSSRSSRSCGRPPTGRPTPRSRPRCSVTRVASCRRRAGR